MLLYFVNIIKFKFVDELIAWQSIYFNVSTNHLLINHVNISITPYTAGIDSLRIYKSDEANLIFSTFNSTNGVLTIRHESLYTLPSTAYLSLLDSVQYKMQYLDQYPTRCMDYYRYGQRIYITMTAVDGQNRVSNKMTVPLSIVTAAVIYNEFNTKKFRDIDATIEYQLKVPNAAQNITYNVASVSD